MLKNKIKCVFLFFVFCSLIIPTFGIENVNAGKFTGDNNVSPEAKTSSCGSGWCFNDERYGLRFSIVDSNGNVKGNAIDVFYSGNEVNNSVPRINRFGGNSFKVKTYFWYHIGDDEWIYTRRNKYNVACNASNGCKEVKNTEDVAKLLRDFGSKQTVFKMIEGGVNSNYDQTIDQRIRGLMTNSSTITEMFTLLGIDPNILTENDYLVVEPFSVIIYTDSGGSYYFYGTAYELDNFLVKNGGSGETTLRKLIYGRLGRAMYSVQYNITLNALTNKEINGFNNNLSVNQYINKWNNYPFGAAIYKITDLVSINKCDINKNDNDNKEYNWVESYSCKTYDLDGKEINSTCWRKISNGCCDSTKYTAAGYTKAQVVSKYPQCFVNECKDSSKKYLNDTKTDDFDDPVSCSISSQTMSNLKGYTTKQKEISSMCLTSDIYIVGSYNNWRIGCTFFDEFDVPSKYVEPVGVGQYFVWPTSKTVYEQGVHNINYPLTRTSKAKCLLYKYDSAGTIIYPKSSDITTKLKEKITNFFKDKVTGQVYLTYQGIRNGKLKSESTTSNFSWDDSNKLSTVTVDKVYTLQTIDKSTKVSGQYAYYDNEELIYINDPTKELSAYTKYGYPILPVGNYKDRDKGQVKVAYGLDFENIKFSKLDKYDAKYICDKIAIKTSAPCKCPPGTKREGMALELTGYVDFKAACANEIDAKCNNPIPTACINSSGKSIDISSCMDEQKKNGKTEDEAYNACNLEYCYCEHCCPNDKTKSIAGCIQYEADADKYESCVKDICNPDLGKDIIYRTIFLNNPFPGINGTNNNWRTAGSNWGGPEAMNANGLGTKYIIETADKMYQGKPMYRIILDPAAITRIRSYNSEEKNGYDDFKLTCENGKYCVSEALHGDKGVLRDYLDSASTCYTSFDAKSTEKSGTNKDCRIKALEG